MFFFVFLFIYLFFSYKEEQKDKKDKLQFTLPFDAAFLDFLFDSFKYLKSQIDSNKTDIRVLSIHVYASILHESFYGNGFCQKENLSEAINFQIVEFLFKLLNENDEQYSDYREDNLIEMRFYDKKLIACRCLPLIINVLHFLQQDKRLVDLNVVLEKMLDSFAKNQRDGIKLEMIRAYYNVLNECSDRAALKTVIVTKRYLNCLFEQTNTFCLAVGCQTNKRILYEFLYTYLSLIKVILENSDSIKV